MNTKIKTIVMVSKIFLNTFNIRNNSDRRIARVINIIDSVLK